MIRAKLKNNDTFVYIYYIYKQKNSEGNYVLHYLSSVHNCTGLFVYFEDEIYNIEYMNDQKVFGEYIHPVLEYFLNNRWEVYEGIVEGDLEYWLMFEEKLGFRP